MDGAAETVTRPAWKNPFVYTGALIVVLAIYIGWIVFSRWNENRTLEQRARDVAAEKQREQDKNAVEQMGGSELAIQSFYGNPTIKRGQTGQLCYGVANAKKVTLEPPIEPGLALLFALCRYKPNQNNNLHTNCGRCGGSYRLPDLYRKSSVSRIPPCSRNSAASIIAACAGAACP